MDPTRKNRQTRFKERMRAAGKLQMTVWATPAQKDAIKEVLSGEPRSPSAIDQLAAKEAELQAREKEVGAREERALRALRLGSDWQKLEEAERRLHYAQKELEQRQKLLEREQAALSKKELRCDQISFADRRAKLIEIFTTSKDWRTGAAQTIDTSWRADDTKKQMAGLSRKTRLAANTIGEVREHFQKHDLLSEREKDALDLARSVLGALATAASEAKDSVVAHARRIRDQENERARVAHSAAKELLGDQASVADTVAILDWKKDDWCGSFWAFQAFRKDVIQDGKLSYLRDAQRYAADHIADRIAAALKAGKSVAEASAQVRADFDAVRPKAIEKYAGLIKELHAAVVANQLEVANSKRPKR